jgi:SAM-dependent methyltransferase
MNMRTSLLIVALLAAWASAISGATAQSAVEPSPPQGPMGDRHHHMGDHGGHGDKSGSAPGTASTEGFHRRFNDAEKWAKEFDNPERDAWQKPDDVLDALQLPPTALVADIGAGTGYFSARLAKRLPQGKVFAADVEPDMVRYLGARAEREHLPNLTPVQARPDAANLPEPVDVILVVDTYHHIDDRSRYFAALQSSLRPGGRLVIIDFKADSPNGPPAHHRIPPQQVTQELATAGFAPAGTIEFLPRQYGLVFKKSDG